MTQSDARTVGDSDRRRCVPVAIHRCADDIKRVPQRPHPLVVVRIRPGPTRSVRHTIERASPPIRATLTLGHHARLRPGCAGVVPEHLAVRAERDGRNRDEPVVGPACEIDTFARPPERTAFFLF
jgi:hypothetical protein